MTLSNQILRPRGITPGNTTYASVILADHPVAYYRLNETGGTSAHDSSGHGNAGTILGGVTKNQQGSWMGSAAMQFDGSTGYIVIPPAFWSKQTPTNFSVEAWITHASQGVLLGGQSTSVGSTPSSGWNPLLWIDGGSLYGNALSQSGSGLSGTIPGNRESSYCALVANNGRSYLYLDGQCIATKAQSPNYNNGVINYLQVGVCYTKNWNGTSGGWFYFDGNLDNLSIYFEALSPAQIQQHYNAGRTALHMTGGITV